MESTMGELADSMPRTAGDRGEKIAIGILEEQKLCFNERFSFSLTKFDGTTVRI